MKNVWVTSLIRDEAKVTQLLKTARKYGLSADGHFWEDDLKKMSWLGPRDRLVDDSTATWIILASGDALARESVRCGLSLLALSAQARRGHGFPILLIHDGEAPPSDTLPTPIQGAETIAADHPSLGAKIVARANIPPGKVKSEYRLDIYAMPQLGLWFEVGPAAGEWEGAMLGVYGADIDAHGEGPAGKLPEKAVLEYPMQGLKIDYGGKSYTAWAIRNRLDNDSSYYVRLTGVPESVLLGPLPQGEEAEAFVLKLK
jgi:hypothetical protein